MLTFGVKMMFCLRAIKPGIGEFRVNKFNQYPILFRELSKDPLVDRYCDAVEAHSEIGYTHRFRALFDVACALTTQGIEMADLTPPALLYYSAECKRLGVAVGASKDHGRFSALLAWRILCEIGHFPPDTPPTLRAYIYEGQKTVEQLVDRYAVQDPAIRRLLIEYLQRRKVAMDYVSLCRLPQHLVGLFWKKVEEINPGQGTLALSEPVWEQWLPGLQMCEDGKRKRKHKDSVLLVARALYLDLQGWAIEEPERWAQWVVPCPVRPERLRGFGQRRRRVNEETANRIRVRQPLLPGLVAHVEDHFELYRDLLAAGEQAEPGEEVEVRGRRYLRPLSKEDRRIQGHGHEPNVRLVDQETGTVYYVTTGEDSAFWVWAEVEVLRLSGIRIEELVELTQLSVRQYQRPNGEVVALLVIAPSKTDRERVIPMSAELFHVIAMIIKRLTRGGKPIGLLNRYDTHEKTWTAPMPYLFQRRLGTVEAVTAPGTVLQQLKTTCKELAEHNPGFAGRHFTPHDFRRLFATELVNNGLPIHIGAALLGHLSISTTQGYVAVFAEDLVRHYQEYLNNRRALRPQDEYREVTEEEWADFEEHFDKRKVELGGCGRPYGTGCEHEHACIRCPLLQVNPKMLGRLDEIELDLIDRRKRADAEGWMGEIEKIDLTLTYLRGKREQTRRLMRIASTAPTDLGMPQLPSARQGA